jgi:diguanylate cyclase (GGDEF)-like protein
VIRTQFLVLALLSVHVFLGALCLAAAREESRTAALRWWGAAMMVYAAGLAFTLSGFLPAPVSSFIGNLLIAASSAVAARGVLPLAGRSLNPLAAAAIVGATAVVLAAGNFGGLAELAVNMVTPTVAATVFFAWAAAALFREPPADAVRAARFVAYTFVVAIVVWWVRVAAIALLLAEPVDRERFDIVIALLAIAQILVGVSAGFGLLWTEVQLSHAALSHMAFTDPLTGLLNRRSMVERFDEALARAQRSGRALALAVFDVDHFKAFNDSHGHLAGDEALRHVGRLLATGKRSEELLGRIGGEEFVLVMEGASPRQALAAADRLRESVAAKPVAHEGAVLPLRLSGGLATYPEDGDNWDALFAAADARLYEAKGAGRNRVVGRPAG